MGMQFSQLSLCWSPMQSSTSIFVCQTALSRSVDCQGCLEVIEPKSLMIGQQSEFPGQARNATIWFHGQCAVAKFSCVGSAESIAGFQELSALQQKALIQLSALSLAKRIVPSRSTVQFVSRGSRRNDEPTASLTGRLLQERQANGRSSRLGSHRTENTDNDRKQKSRGAKIMRKVAQQRYASANKENAPPLAPPQHPPAENPRKRKLDAFGPSASKAKLLRFSPPVLPPRPESTYAILGNRILRPALLQSALSKIAGCRHCHIGSVRLCEVGRPRGGLSNFRLSCSNPVCGKHQDFASSLFSRQDRIADINKQLKLGSQLVGLNRTGVQKFLLALDLPPPLSTAAWSHVERSIIEPIIAQAEDSMKRAVAELRQKLGVTDAAAIAETSVATDATWSNRFGHMSLDGLVSAKGENGKILDFESLSSICGKCSVARSKKTTAEFAEWYRGHRPECFGPFRGSAGSMETEGTSRIFRRSEGTRKLRYVRRIGDGEAAVEKHGPDVSIQKKEDPNHAAKAFGHKVTAELDKLKKTGFRYAGSGKGIGGKGRLTDNFVKYLQKNVSRAVLQNRLASLAVKQNAVRAAVRHGCGIHDLCPGQDAEIPWCRVRSGNKEYKPSIGYNLPREIFDEHLEAWTELFVNSDRFANLAEEGTNANESFNNSLWRLLPKERLHGHLEIAIVPSLAVCLFNDGHASISAIFRRLGISLSHNFERIDNSRLYSAARKSSVRYLSRRLFNRSGRRANYNTAKGANDYQAGGFFGL